MFFSNDDDDTDFLSPAGGSKLANLFGADQSLSKGGNESLTYTAPKQPKMKKSDDDTAASTNAPALLHAIAAHTYKFVDGKSVSQGKLGVALLGNHAEADYKILVYKSKQEQITHVTVTPAFKLSIHANNYASFYDDQRQGWSLMFDSEQAIAAFAKQVGLAVAGAAGGNIDKLIIQDLCLGEGNELDFGDSVEVSFTGWLFKNNAPAEEFDTNIGAEKLLRLKLGKGKILKGWEDGMLGMRKGGKRLLVIPASLGYGAKGNGAKVPPNSTLVIETEIVRVKFGKDKDTASIAESVTSNSSDVQATEETSVKARTKSIDEQLNKGVAAAEVKPEKGSDKARLISRMAKMGQAMLPGKSPAQQDAQDSDEEDSQGSETAHATAAVPQKPPVGAKPNKPSPYPQQPQPDLSHPIQQPAFDPVTGQPLMTGAALPGPIGAPHWGMPQPSMTMPSQAVFQGVPMASQLALYQSPMQQPGYPQMYPPPPHYAAAAGLPAPVPPASTTASELPVLLSESRQQNTEIRLTLSRMADKVDHIHSKIDGLHQNVGGMMSSSSAPAMETTVLVQNIQRIVAENERLKKEVFERSARIEAQNEKINELLQRNQKYVEQSNSMLEQRNDAYKTTATQSQHKVLTLEQEKVQLANELSSTTAQLADLQLELNNSKKQEMELATQLDASTTVSRKQLEELNSLRERLKECEKQLESSSTSLKEERLTKKQIETQYYNVREELNDLKVTHEALDKNFNEKRQKYTAEKKKLEEELEEVKAQYETEVSSLKDKLRKQKSTTDVAAAEQVTQLEKELVTEWKEKCDRLLANANDRHQRSLQDAKDELQQLESKIADLEDKMSQAKSTKLADEKAKQDLQHQVDDLQIWKEKYEKLRKQAGEMKQKYEERLAEVEEERDVLEQQRDVAIRKAQDAVAAAAAAAAAAAGPAAAGPAGSGDVAGEVKKIMNTVYKQLKAEFEASRSYSGQEIHSAILQTIKEVTLSMLQPQEEEDEDTGTEVEDDTDSMATVKQESVTMTTVKKEPVSVATGQDTSLPDNTARAAQLDGESHHMATQFTSSHISNSMPQFSESTPTYQPNYTQAGYSSEVPQYYEHMYRQPPPALSSDPDSDVEDSDDDDDDDKYRKMPSKTKKRMSKNTHAGMHSPDGWVTATEDVLSDPDDRQNKVKVEQVEANNMPQQTVNDEEIQAIMKKDKVKFDNRVKVENKVKEELQGKEIHVQDKVTVESIVKDDKFDEDSEMMVNSQNRANEHLSQDILEGAVAPMADLSNPVMAPTEEVQVDSPVATEDQADAMVQREVKAEVVPKVTKADEQDLSQPKDIHVAFSEGSSIKASVVEHVQIEKKEPEFSKVDVNESLHQEVVDTVKDEATKSAAELEATAAGDSSKPTASAKPTEVDQVKVEKTGMKEFEDEESSELMAEQALPKHTNVTAPESADSGDVKPVIEPSIKAVTAAEEHGQAPSGGIPSSKHTEDPQKAKLLGDKGNPYYLEELKKASEHIEKVGAEKSKDIQSTIEGMIIASEASIRGDKGNVKYGEEIAKNLRDKAKDKQSKDKDVLVKEEVMVAQTANLQSAGKPASSKQHGKAGPASLADIESSITAGVTEPAKPVSKEHVKPGPASLADIESSIIAGVTEPAKPVSKKHAKPGPASLADIESSIIAGVTEPTKPGTKEHAKPGPASLADIESSIMAATASITGDKGNVYYAEELKKAADEKSAESKNAGKDMQSAVEDLIVSSKAAITGDKGNVHYGKELDKAKDSKASSKDKPNDAKANAEQAHAEAGMFVKEEVMTQSAAPLQSAGKPPSPTPDKNLEESISAVTASITGDKGNVHYAEELKKAAKDNKAQDISKSIEDTIIPVSSSITGDKGNPYYAAEIRGEKLTDEPKPKKAKAASDVLGDIESSIITASSQDKKKTEKDQKSAKDHKSAKGAKKDKSSDKEKKSTPAGSASILDDIESSIISDPLFGAEVITKDSSKPSKAAPKKATTQAKPKSLFDDETDDPLFGSDDTFSKPLKKSDKKPAAKKSDKKANSDSEEDWKPKPPPPPLFGDEDDDDDLNWLS